MDETGTPNDQPLLRIKVSEGPSDTFEAEGAESTVMHELHEWQRRMDALRAESTATMDRLMAQRGGPGRERGIELQ